MCRVKVKKSHPKVANREMKECLDCIHTDIMGKMKVPSIGGSNFVVTFIDEYSRYGEVPRNQRYLRNLKTIYIR